MTLVQIFIEGVVKRMFLLLSVGLLLGALVSMVAQAQVPMQQSAYPLMPTAIPGGAVYAPAQAVMEQPPYATSGAMGCNVGRYDGTVLQNQPGGQIVPMPAPAGHQ